MAELEPITHENLRTPGKRRAPQRHTARFAAVAGTIPSPNYSSRGGTKVTGVVIHSAEGLTDANALGNYFAKASVQASSHVGIDDTKTVAYVDPQFEAWTLRNGNPWTDNAEMCAFAAWTRDQWLAHPGMLQQAAAWVAERCRARNVPPQRITAADIKAGRRSGYFAHWDYTQGTGDGTHWDVGTGFPWDTFDGLVQAAYNGTPPTPTPAPSEEDDMFTAFRSAPQYGGNGSIFLAGPGGWKPCYSMTLLGWYRHLGILRKGLDGDGAFAGSYTDISPAQIDHLAAMFTAGVTVPVPPSNIL